MFPGSAWLFSETKDSENIQILTFELKTSKNESRKGQGQSSGDPEVRFAKAFAARIHSMDIDEVLKKCRSLAPLFTPVCAFKHRSLKFDP